MEIKFPIKLLLAVINARQYNHCYTCMVLAQKPFTYSGCVVVVMYKKSIDSNDNQNY